MIDFGALPLVIPSATLPPCHVERHPPPLSCRPSVSAWRHLMKCAHRRKRLKPQRSLDYARDDKGGRVALGMTKGEG